LRREKWRLGAREDWRYEEMRAAWGGHWWWWSLVPVYAVQHALLAGLALPAYVGKCGAELPWAQTPQARAGLLARFFAPAPPCTLAPWTPLDSASVALSLAGLALAAAADTQLHAHLAAAKARGVRAPLLRSGVWRVSRHPNYVGETLFWAGTALSAAAAGGKWAAAGWGLNTACLAAVTLMTERRTAASRPAAGWAAHCAQTPCWAPLGPLSLRRVL
jgi:steroid 5-alpha reductase family enzyme